MTETMSTAQINAELVITRFNGERFEALDKDGYFEPKGYAFKHPTLGWFAFSDTQGCPYNPKGGKRALESILSAGGFTDFEGAVWLKELQNTSA